MREYPWLRLLRKSQPELPAEPPLRLGAISNGEFFSDRSARDEQAQKLILEKAEDGARRHGVDRRTFLASSLGMATSLSVVNLVSGCNGGKDGGFDMPDGATDDPDAACQALSTDPFFIFDIQTHHVDEEGDWRQTRPDAADGLLTFASISGCDGNVDECLSFDKYVQDIFMNSDTHVAVLSGVPGELCDDGKTNDCGLVISNDAMARSRDRVNNLANSQRLINHAIVMPNLGVQGQLEIMERVQKDHGVGAWKLYPPWGPSGTGWWMDDEELGIPVIQKALELDVDVMCIHKGFPFPNFDAIHTNPRDIGVVAKQFPEMRFVVYHSAHKHGQENVFGMPQEGPYDPMGQVDPQNPSQYPVDRGVNSLIKAMQDNDIGPNENVYAELGGLWMDVMRAPDQAQHVIGKLLKYVGEDNVLWGTDSIWFGSPQQQIEAFISFQISEELQEKYGYPALTEKRKAKILGLNSARLYGIDPEARRCAIEDEPMMRTKRQLDGELGARRWAMQPPRGPRTRREFFALKRATGGQPG